jgi:beta-phosphoglucomutase-like phosphatase (HAD superfamily)
VLGLPEKIQALLFDMDGVLTKTATVHAQAWKHAFDAFLRERAQQTGDQSPAGDLHAARWTASHAAPSR